jgi:hypothetical protein
MSKSDSSVPFSNQRSLSRAQHLPPYILDRLCEYGDAIYNEYMKRYDNLCPEPSGAVDRDIVSFFDLGSQVQNLDAGITRELDVIQKQVDEIYLFWIKACSKASNRFSISPSKSQFQSKSRENKKAFDDLRRQFATSPEGVPILQALRLVDKMKASYAFKKSQKFAFCVAYRVVCEIKAEAAGTLSPIARPFADILGVPASIARLYARDWN